MRQRGRQKSDTHRGLAEKKRQRIKTSKNERDNVLVVNLGNRDRDFLRRERDTSKKNKHHRSVDEY